MKCDTAGNIYCTAPGGTWITMTGSERIAHHLPARSVATTATVSTSRRSTASGASQYAPRPSSGPVI
jgi:hypothetical protein